MQRAYPVAHKCAHWQRAISRPTYAPVTGTRKGVGMPSPSARTAGHSANLSGRRQRPRTLHTPARKAPRSHVHALGALWPTRARHHAPGPPHDAPFGGAKFARCAAPGDCPMPKTGPQEVVQDAAHPEGPAPSRGHRPRRADPPGPADP